MKINSASPFMRLDWQAWRAQTLSRQQCWKRDNVPVRGKSPKHKRHLRKRTPTNFSVATAAMWQPRCSGILLSAFLVVACLATIGLPQSDSAGGLECEAVRAVVGISARVILDSATLKELDNDVQSLVDCMPVGGVLELDLAELVLDDSVELSSPIIIDGNGATVQCPGDQGKGAFKIRSDDVTLSTLAFKGCFLNSLEGLIHVQSSKNITLKHVEFKGNQNVGKAPSKRTRLVGKEVQSALR
ncbi:hypothetical protein BSKO_06797 [Bryopsis sp. KO-2023]|nr:hypothetical protein BSKO_06797 [Bryopsis sp. KO-2023]